MLGVGNHGRRAGEEKLEPTVLHVSVPRILDETVDVTSLALHERVQQQTVDVPMPSGV